MKRISLRRFGRIVARVMETLPPEFEPYLENLVVDVEEEPDRETLLRQGFTEQEIAGGDSLYGLFVPIELPSAWSNDGMTPHELPHQILIYKRPLEEDFPDPRQLMIEIRKTVIHELAHHFGFDEADLERFDANPNPFPDEID